MKLALGKGSPLIGRLLLFHALDMKFRELKLRRDPQCPICGEKPTLRELIDYEQFCGLRGESKPPEDLPDEVTVQARISVPKFDMHNGKTAKKRALTNARVKRFRNAEGVTKASPEKNREDKTPKPPKGGFPFADAKKKNGARFDLSTDLKIAAAWRQELGRDPPPGKSADECRQMFWQKVKEAQHLWHKTLSTGWFFGTTTEGR